MAGVRFLHPNGLPAAVLTYLASDPSDTLYDIANDLPGKTIREVQLAAASLVRREFMAWDRTAELYVVTPRGWREIEHMLSRPHYSSSATASISSDSSSGTTTSPSTGSGTGSDSTS